MIQINKVLYEQRKKKGLTQQEIANYLLVTKASVSKWESGTSYPDITMLPRLASFYQITLDELFHYEGLLTKKEIKEIYEECATAFNHNSFEEVYSKIQGYLGTYLGSDELQMQLNILLVNHLPNQSEEILIEILERFIKLQESKDYKIVNQAKQLEGVTYLFLKDYEKIIELYAEDEQVIFNQAHVLSSAYILKEEFSNASKVLEIRMFQDILILLGNMITYTTLHLKQIEKMEEKITTLITLFNLEKIHKGNVMTVYLQLASIYSQIDKEKTLHYLEEYTRVIIDSNDFIHIQKDDFFSIIPEWMEELTYSTFPRSEQTIKESMIEVFELECFKGLKEERRYLECILQLRRKLK